MALAPEAVARRLAGAVPRTARRIAYVGPQVEAFRAACLRIHPQAAVTEAQGAAEACDAVVLHHPAPEDVSCGVIERLADGGLLLATAPLGERARALRETVGRLGLTLLPGDRIITPSATALLRARKGPAPATVRLDFVAFARMLMDIRTHLPTDALRSQPELKVSYLVPPFRIDPGDPQPGRLLILQRPGRNPPERIWDLAARAILADTVVVIEFDDHPELVSQIIRGKNLVDEDWEAYRAVHGVQTTNDLLLEVFGRRNPEVRAFQNAVFDLPPFPAGPRPQRVFYGGVTRGPFVAEVAAALKPAIEAFPDADFIVLGDRAFFDALPTDKKQYADYVGYDRYLELMARCTVNLSPLAYRPMMETKSDAKYLDSARCGSLMIASPTVYERAIRHGENGFIARELADWPKLLAQALGDEAGRERMARAAYEEVRASRMFAHQVPDRLAWYSSLLERREALNRAILERRPQVAQRLAQLRKHFGR